MKGITRTEIKERIKKQEAGLAEFTQQATLQLNIEIARRQGAVAGLQQLLEPEEEEKETKE